MFVNDLVCEINVMDLGVTLDGENISLLLYADDIAIVAENELNLQAMLDKRHDWCKKVRILSNTDTVCISEDQNREVISNLK